MTSFRRIKSIFWLDSLPIVIEPEIPIRYRWISGNELQIMPTSQLLPATEYTVTVQPEFPVGQGKTLTGNLHFELQTPRMSVASLDAYVRPVENDPLLASIQVALLFTEEVNTEDIHSQVQIIDPQGNRVPFVIDPPEGIAASFELTTEAIERAESNEAELRVTVDKDITPVGGQLSMERGASTIVPFGAPGELTVRSVNARQIGDGLYIQINFSDPVNPVQAQQFVQLMPEQATTSTRVSSNWIQISGQFRPGEQATITILEGLRAENGARLPEHFRQTVQFPDLQPKIEFASPGSYLNSDGLGNVEINVTNIDTIHIEIAKIYPNNLLFYLQDSYGYNRGAERYGYRLHEENIPVFTNDRQDLEAPASVTVNLREYIDRHPSGLFNVTVRKADRYWIRDSRTVILTDIGLIAKRTETELHVWAISTNTLDPISQVRIQLISSNNQEIAFGRTDSQGHVVLNDINTNEDEYTPYLIVAQLGEDLSYLRFADTEIDRSEFDITGRPPLVQGYEAFLYGDRDLYRPGETAHLASILRSAHNDVPSDFPVRLSIVDPRGRVFLEQQGRAGLQGMSEFTVELPDYALTGNYRAELRTSGSDPDGRYEFQVEEFMPDRMKVEIETGEDRYRTGETLTATVTGTMLFGPPAAGRRANAAIYLESRPFTPVEYSNYHYGNLGVEFSSTMRDMELSALDDNGHSELEFAIPSNLQPPSAMQARIQASVHEQGGRAVTNSIVVPIDPYPLYLGIRKHETGYAPINEDVQFDYIALTPEGEPVAPGEITATLIRYRYNTTLQRDRSGHYRYVSERVEEEVTSQTFSGDIATGSFQLSMPQYGSYSVRLRHNESGMTSNVTFYASGWGYSPWSMEYPERITLELDKERYRPGETAQVLVKAPFSGLMLLTTECEDIYTHNLIRLQENTAQIDIPVRDEYGANIYVTAMLVRSVHDIEAHTPSRAFGTVPLLVDRADNQLSITIDAPETMRPRNTLEMNLTVRGGSGSSAVTVAAVDEGILQLTDYETPDAFDFFFSKRALGVRSYDIFSLLLPEVEQAEIHSSTGGGRSGRDRDHVSGIQAMRVHPVALWSGIVEARNGRARVSLDVPEFNGRLRVMALAVNGDEYGSAEEFVIVRDPIVLQPTLPRFAAGQDRFQVPVSIFNGTGQSGSIEIALEVNGPLQILGETARSLVLSNEQEGFTGFELLAQDAFSPADVLFRASRGRESCTVSVTLPVRPPVPPVSRTGSGSVRAGERERIRVPSDFIEGTTQYNFLLMPRPDAQFGAALQYLLQYPHGCTEQTVSQAFPLLYYSELAGELNPEQYGDNAHAYYVNHAITKLSGLQQDEGSFRFWPSYSSPVNVWTSSYAMHFLAEAQRRGYSVPNRIISRGIRYQRQIARGNVGAIEDWFRRLFGAEQLRAEEIRRRAYACYVLALLNQPERGAMNLLYEDYRDDMSADVKALLAGAFAQAGDLGTARSLMPERAYPFDDNVRYTGYSFHSATRANASILYVLADVAPDHALVPVLMQELLNRRHLNRWYTTQENAWVLLALGRLYSQTEEPDYHGTVEINGDDHSVTTETFTHRWAEMSDETIEINLDGQGQAYYYWEARGIPTGRETEVVNEGIEIRRTLYTASGGPVSYDNIRQGDLVVVELRMKTQERVVRNVVVDDMLPAGLEIENPRLESRDRPDWIRHTSMTPDYLDIRDDRLLLYTNLYPGEEQRFYYIVRAVTAGRFTLPPVTAECMYNPALRASNSAGFVQIVAGNNNSGR